MIAQLDWQYIRTKPLKSISRLNSYFFIEGRPVTTRGQWINPFVLYQLRLVKLLPIAGKVIKPIFILGMGRSGTTILGKVLSIHKQVGFLNEPKALWHVVYPDEDIFGNYSKNPGRYRLDEKDCSESNCLSAHKLYKYSMFLTGSRRIADKYPEMIFRVPFLRCIFPDAKFILLVRSGWDTLQSVESWSNTKGNKNQNNTHDWWGVNNRKWKLLVKEIVDKDPKMADIAASVSTISSQEDRAAVEWVSIMQEALRHIRSAPEEFLVIRFEEFIGQFEYNINRLLKFCELPEDSHQLEYAKRILSPRPAYGMCSLHPAIEGIFRETMEDFDYT